MTRKFPSGVEFDNLEIYNDILLVDLPPTGKLAIDDVGYLGSMVLALGLSGLNVSVGEFTAFISCRAIEEYLNEETTSEQFMNRWEGFIWQIPTVKQQPTG